MADGFRSVLLWNAGPHTGIRQQNGLGAILMLVEVTIRIGGVGLTSRTTVRYDDNRFDFNLEESYATLVARVNTCAKAALESFATPTDRTDATIYLRQSTHGPQRDLVGLTETNFRSSIAVATANFDKRKKTTGPFVCSLTVYAARCEPGGEIRRETAGRVNEAAAAVDRFLGENPDVQVGEVARTHWTTTHARQPDHTPVAVPQNPTFQQMQFIDGLRAQQSTNEGDSDDEGVLMIRLANSEPIPAKLSKRALRSFLGLPNHNLLARGIFSSFVPPEQPAVDVEDLDHASDNESDDDQ